MDTLTHCVHCRWQAIYDSKVVEVAGDLTPEAVGIDTLLAVACACLCRLITEGSDPPEVIARRCHVLGTNFLPSLRLNDQHGMHPHEGHYGSFCRDHPEWIVWEQGPGLGSAGGARAHLRVVREPAERYDIDGLDLDFMRWPVYFKSDEVKANTPLVTDFIGGSAPSLTKRASAGAGTCFSASGCP